MKNAMKIKDLKSHIRLWTSEGLKIKIKAVCNAGWVAFGSVCEKNMLTIQEAQQYPYKCITENPTYEEAMRNVKQLAVHFQKELDEAQKAIAKRIFEADKEIEELKDE